MIDLDLRTSVRYGWDHLLVCTCVSSGGPWKTMQAAQLDTSVPPRGPMQIRGIGGRSQGKGGPIPRDEVAGATKVARSASLDA